MGQYRPLFTVSVEHAYFADGLWKNLLFTPSSATNKVISGAGMLMRQMEGGLRVFYDEEKLPALKLYAAETGGKLQFSFKVRARDKTFANYTSPPIRRGDTILYFRNPEPQADAAESGRLSREGLASLLDLIEVDTLVTERILNARERWIPPDFVVDILVAPDAEADSAGRTFFIKFDCRRSYWKYYLLGQAKRDNAFITDLDHRVEFFSCGEVLLPGNRPAAVFRSKERIPVLEQSGYRFQLREQEHGVAKVLVKRLPVASETRLGLEIIDGKDEIVLENYINF